MTRRFVLMGVLYLGAAMAMATVLDVRDFGAKGDGVADDFPAIQRALNKAEEMRAADERLYVNNYGEIPSWGVYDGGNPEIRLPKGTYRLSRTLVGTKGVTIIGEDGAVLEGADDSTLLLYLDRAFRCTVRNVTFRRGGSQLCFWTKNQDTTAILIEDCRFEKSSDYAVFTEAWSSVTTDNWDHMEMVSPFKVEWDDDKMPTLTPQTWETGAPNSTRLCIRNCQFIDCAGAFRGGTDGIYINDCKFVSALPQRLPPWILGNTATMCDTVTIAAIPEDYAGGWIGGRNNSKVSTSGSMMDVRRVDMVSTTDHGAPFLVLGYEKRSETSYKIPGNVMLEDNWLDLGGHPLIKYENCDLAHLTVVNCHERRGRKSDMFTFNWEPKTDEDLLEASWMYQNCPQPTAELSHALVIHGNGPELNVNLPEKLKPFLQDDVPAELLDEFPALERHLRPIDRRRVTKVLLPEDFGLTQTADDEQDTDRMAAMVAAAAKEEFPLVRLPSRRLVLTRTITLPRRCIIEAEGRSFVHGATRDFDLFAFESGLGVDVEFSGIGFNGGRRVLTAEGYGDILVRNCTSYDNEGFWVNRTGEAPLHLELVDSTFYNPVLVDSIRADVRIFDCWSEIQTTLEKAAHIRNDRGTLLVQNLLGVPVVFADWEAYPNWRYGHDIFWFKNTDGVIRTRDMRYGGEFGGIPVVDNFGKGKVLIEGQMVFFYAPSCAKAIFRNRSTEATVVIRQMSSFFEHVPGCLFCDGVLPDKLSTVGCLIPTGLTARPFAESAQP